MRISAGAVEGSIVRERDVLAEEPRDLGLQPLQGDGHQRQEVELHVVASDGDVPVLVLQRGDELLVGEAVDVHPQTLRQRRCPGTCRSRRRGSCCSAWVSAGASTLASSRQRILDASVKVRGLRRPCRRRRSAHRCADLGVLGDRGDDLHVGLGVEDDAARPEGERAHEDGEHGSDDEEQRDAGADARRAPGGEGAPDGGQGARDSVAASASPDRSGPCVSSAITIFRPSRLPLVRIPR